jgi:hypothetical protein
VWGDLDKLLVEMRWTRPDMSSSFRK